MSQQIRRKVIDRRRRRTGKIRKLKAKILKSKDGNQVAQLVAKILKIHPHYPLKAQGLKG